MVAAIDWFTSQSDAEFEKEFRRRCDVIAAQLKDIPTVTAEVFIPPVANNVPHLLIRYDESRREDRAEGGVESSCARARRASS